MIFVDTNYFLRFLIADEQDQHLKALDLFQKAGRGEIELTTSIIVFFEIYWVLKSFYSKEKSELYSVLNKILQLEFIKLPERNILVESVKIYSDYKLDVRIGVQIQGKINL